jgi:hypothetical protein
MISRAQIRAALAAASLEWLLTHPLAFGLETATDLQRSVCRVAEGQPVTMTESVRRGFGCDTLPTCAPREIILLGGVRTAKSLLAAAVHKAMTEQGLANVEHRKPDPTKRSVVPGILPAHRGVHEVIGYIPNGYKE